MLFTIQEIVIAHANSPKKLARKLDFAFSESYLCSSPNY